MLVSKSHLKIILKQFKKLIICCFSIKLSLLTTKTACSAFCGESFGFVAFCFKTNESGRIVGFFGMDFGTMSLYLLLNMTLYLLDKLYKN